VRWYFEEEKLVKTARDEQSARTQNDPWDSVVLDWAMDPHPITLSDTLLSTPGRVLTRKCCNTPSASASEIGRKRTKTEWPRSSGAVDGSASRHVTTARGNWFYVPTQGTRLTKENKAMTGRIKSIPPGESLELSVSEDKALAEIIAALAAAGYTVVRFSSKEMAQEILDNSRSGKPN
jgi:hypothetical protein